MLVYHEPISIKNYPKVLMTSIRSHCPDYGDAPFAFVKRLGIPAKEWAKTKTVTVLRMCTLNPFLAHLGDTNTIWKEYLDLWKVKLQTIIKDE